MAQLYYDTVEVGDPIPTLQKPPINRTQIARFAAASGDYGPLHVDEEVGRASGYGSVMAHGMIAMAYVGEMLEKWLQNGRVARMEVRFLKFIWPGDVLSAKGVVVPKPDGDGNQGIVCDVWVQNQNNDKVLDGKAYCVLFQNPEQEKKNGKGKPEAVFMANEYQSPSKKSDMARASSGPSDKPPQRPPPKAAGTPVKLSEEAAELARQQEAEKKASAKAAGKTAKAEPVKAAAKVEPKKPEPKKVEAKAAPRKPEPKKPEPKKEAKPAAKKPEPKKEAKKPAPKKPEPKKEARKAAPKPAAKKDEKKGKKDDKKKKKK